jgi:hypothetical protein
MDVEGLVTIIEANHAENLRHLEGLSKQFSDQRTVCNSRMDSIDTRCGDMCKTVKAQGKTITQIRTIGSLAVFVWGAIVALVSHGGIFGD